MMRGFRAAAARPAAGRVAASMLMLLLSGARLAAAGGYDLQVNSTDSIKSVASDMAADMMSYYNGNEPGNVPGLLPAPYYWWEAGALMSALIDYWYYTGDTKYNNITQEGLLFQVGPNNDYMPPNQTRTEGNDDQGFWGMAVMTAAEYNFQNPPASDPQWLALAQAVFNTQAARWDAADCNGGLRWQIFTWNNGFDYKNSISQACFFNIAARLALYTGNDSYAAWADKTWDWMIASKFMSDETYYIYDGAHIENCSDVVPYQWTYNAGAFLLGAAAMYNYTNGSTQDMWKTRVDGLLNGTQIFFSGNDSNIMTEVACEPVNLCDVDQQSFKAYLSRWMAATTKWAPWTYERILPLLQSSATAAASQCTGGQNGRTCGLKWTDNGKWDGTSGVGQQMAAMEVVLATMIAYTEAPVTNSTGGTSQGDASAGGSDVGRTNPFDPNQYFSGPVTTGDKAGAYICTVAVLVGLVAGIIWILLDEKSDRTMSQQMAAAFSASAGAAVLVKRNRDSRDEKGQSYDTSDSDRGSNIPYYSNNSNNTTTGKGVLAGTRRASDLSTRSAPAQPAFDSNAWRMTAPGDMEYYSPQAHAPYMTAREARFSHPGGRSLTQIPSEPPQRASLKKKHRPTASLPPFKSYGP